jgi:two-component system, LytTR family, sensor kinase
MNKRRSEARWVLLVSALAITLFMGIPRLVIISFLKARSYPGIDRISWWDFAQKCLYSFLIACLFLWLNVSRRKIITKIGVLDMTRLPVRLFANLIIYFLIRFVSLQFDLYGSGAMMSGKVAEFMFNITLILEISFCILAAEIYMLLVKNQQVRLKNEMLQKVNAETTFEVLKNQVNPHFLFNSLNTINAMIDKDSAAAKNFVTNMSQVYRHVLNSAGQPVVTLAGEMEFAMAYSNMLQERHAGSLHIHIRITDEYLDDLLPPMSVQILIENAIKHNVVSARMPLAITIETVKRRLIVSNRLQEKKVKEPSTGTGLHNLHQRYGYLCNQGIDIDKADGLFVVSLPLLRIANHGIAYQVI